MSEPDTEEEIFLGQCGKALPSRYEIRHLDRRGKEHVDSRRDSLPAVKEWFYWHPGKRYWVVEIRQSVGMVAEYDLTTSQSAAETAPSASALLEARS